METGSSTWSDDSGQYSELKCLFVLEKTVGGCLYQCDQIVFSIFGHFQQWNLPKSIQIVPKWVENFAQDQINLKYIAKDF